MGFFGLVPTAQTSIATKTAPTNDLLHRLKCKICPLDKADHLRTPKMEPSGSKDPMVYIMGEAPGAQEDKEGLQFVGAAGELLRPHIPAKFKKRIRWNNTIRCRPSTDNRDPDKMEVECCRPFIEQDIEEYKPVAIFGMGAVPLSWTGRGGGIHLWRGRRFPIKVGTHVCWYYPMLHPAGLLHNQKGGKNGKTYPSDDEFAFKLDLKRAFAEVEAGLPEPEVHTAKFARQNITCINGRKKGDLAYVLDFLEYAGNQDVAGVDYETQNKRPYYKNSEILTAAVSVEDETVAFAFRHKEAGWTDSDLRKLDKAWVKFLYSRAKKAVHQLSFESEWSAFYYGVELVRGPPWECTMTQAYVLDERVGDIKPGALSLEFISLQHFGINIKALSPKMNKEKMANERLDVLLPYNGIDAKYHRFNYIIQKKRLKADGTLKVYREKVRQVPTVVLTQLKGIKIDGTVTAELRAEYEKKLERVEARIQEIPEVREFYKKTRQQFNPGSVQDIIVMLRDIIGTREGQPGDGWSTREEVLSQIDNPVCAAILEYRKIVKIKSTYIDPYSPGSEVLYPGNIIHTNLGTCFTETGRLQSDDPNIQNIPTRTEEGKKVRKQFASKVVLSVDYGQIDARIIACGSRDRNYCKALWENYDIHMEWAKRLAYKFPQFVGGKKFLKDEEVLGKFRARVKNQWVFALFYGASIRKTAQRFGVEIEDIMDLYEAFWDQFADVKVWQEEIIRQFQELGYVQLFEGLRRHAPLGYGQQINCVDLETECLTENGWKKVDEIEKGTKIFTKNPQTGEIELQECFGLTRAPYKGKVFTMSGHAVSAVTTMNHRWLISKKNSGPKFTTSEELSQWDKIHIKGEPIKQEGGLWTDDEVRFIGWLLTDGCFTDLKRSYGTYTKVILVQSQKANPEKVKMIDGLFERLFPHVDAYSMVDSVSRSKYSVTKKTKPFTRWEHKESVIRWEVYNNLTNRLKAKLPSKLLTTELLQELSTSQLKILFDTMLLGDGCFYKGEYRRFTAGPKESADAFSALCVLIGQPHKMIRRDMSKYNTEIVRPSMANSPKMGICWYIELKHRDYAKVKYQKPLIKDFEGEVWCPQVPNQTFIARRNNTVYITGNTPVQGATNRIVMLGMNRLSETEVPYGIRWGGRDVDPKDLLLQANMQIHDDLTFMFDSIRDYEDSLPKILDIMLDGREFDWFCVPLVAEVKQGPTWAEQKKVGDFSSVDRLQWPIRSKEFM